MTGGAVSAAAGGAAASNTAAGTQPTGAAPPGAGGCDRGYAICRCLWGREPGSLVRELAQRVPLAGARVLDAGCGEGRNAAYLARLGARVTALDVSALALHNARAAWAGTSGVTWRLADVCTHPLPRAGFDVVICDSLLHWLPDPAAGTPCPVSTTGHKNSPDTSRRRAASSPTPN